MTKPGLDDLFIIVNSSAWTVRRARRLVIIMTLTLKTRPRNLVSNTFIGELRFSYWEFRCVVKCYSE